VKSALLIKGRVRSPFRAAAASESGLLLPILAGRAGHDPALLIRPACLRRLKGAVRKTQNNAAGLRASDAMGLSGRLLFGSSNRGLC
jgi:hypothetical protein